MAQDGESPTFAEVISRRAKTTSRIGWSDDGGMK